MRRSDRGFGVIETLMALFLVGIILGMVGRGYQALSRLNLAAYQMSQRMELTSFLQRLNNEVTNAITLQVVGDGFDFSRIDPTLNLNYESKPPTRLPWPLPLGGALSSVDLLASTYRINTSYRFDVDSNEIRRTAFSATSTVAVDVGEFQATLGSSGRTLLVMVRPKEMTAPVQGRIFLPVVTP